MAHYHSTTFPRAGVLQLQRSALVPLMVAIGVMLALSLFFVWTRLHVLNLEYELSSLEGRIRSERQESAKLKLEAATLRQPARIEQLARNEFGLTMPDPRQMIVVR